MIKKQKFFLTTFLIILSLGIILSSVNVSADMPEIVTVDAMTTNDVSDAADIKQYYSGGTDDAGQGNSFTVSGGNRYLVSASFFVKRIGSPVANFQALLLATGTYTTLASSELISSATFDNASYGWITWGFSGWTYTMQSGTTYVIALVAVNGTTLTSSDYVSVKMDNSHSTHASGSRFYRTSVWNNYAGGDDMFIVTGATVTYEEFYPTPVPTAAPTATPNAGLDDEYYWNGTAWVPVDNIVETTTDLVLPLLIPLIVILICAGLGAYFIGLWGFVLGLDVAVVLLYVALPTYMPLWGVLIVAVGNVIVLLMGRR